MIHSEKILSKVHQSLNDPNYTYQSYLISVHRLAVEIERVDPPYVKTITRSFVIPIESNEFEQSVRYMYSLL